MPRMLKEYRPFLLKKADASSLDGRYARTYPSMILTQPPGTSYSTPNTLAICSVSSASGQAKRLWTVQGPAAPPSRVLSSLERDLLFEVLSAVDLTYRRYETCPRSHMPKTRPPSCVNRHNAAKNW